MVDRHYCSAYHLYLSHLQCRNRKLYDKTLKQGADDRDGKTRKCQFSNRKPGENRHEHNEGN